MPDIAKVIQKRHKDKVWKKMKNYKAYGVRGHKLVSEIIIPENVSASNREEWIKSVKELLGFDNIILMNKEDFGRLFW